ncbi:LicD family protein [Candidatus Mycoplasma mahonii]|uniref:LicD family protein n=1 Tax=Candidatus Mycoplasma mahonii TaxID=3004105 RepID=UPI0026ED8720|nr:LicD family protein [Candidatus Mycoplasma mahonii]WKX02592.1 LicD family protein [Candidatus Mycoplasma mahonii]
MWNDRQKVLKLAKEFVNICEKNNIWYIADNGTLLGAIRNNKIIPWDDDFDVSMTIHSFKKLKKLFPERIIDTNEKGHPLLIPKFLVSRMLYLSSVVFVDIFLIVPSNDKNIKKFTSFRNKTRFAMQCVHSKWNNFNIGTKILWLITLWVKCISKKMSYEEAISILEVPKKQAMYFYTIDNSIDPIKMNKQKILSLKRDKIKFEDFEIYIPIEYKNILINKYGKNYMIPKKYEIFKK